MSVSSVEYLLALFLLASFFFWLPWTWLKQLGFAVCALGFFYSHSQDPRSHLVLLVFLLSGYGYALLLRKRPSRALLTLYLVILVGAFAILKRYEFLKFAVPERIFELRLEIVGLSYILFRQIHFLVDMMQGQIERPSLWAYLNYQLNPFTLLAGPIQRFQDFHAYWAVPAPLLLDRHEILKAFLRLFVGLIKIVLFGAVFQSGFERMLERLDGAAAGSQSGLRSLASFVLLLYCFLFYLYMNFSGYCDVVIAGASLFGLKLPENFNHPFAARNILDYWTRWHITLGQWIRDYLFTPFYKAGVERFPRHAQTLAVVGYFVAFTLAGIWHGSTWNFVIYGLLHGAGASAAKLWENIIIRRAGRPGLKRYLQSATIRRFAVVATFHYTCFSLLFFALDLNQGIRVLGNVVASFRPKY